jgi:hypothetical protein
MKAVASANPDAMVSILSLFATKLGRRQRAHGFPDGVPATLRHPLLGRMHFRQIRCL